MFVLEESHLLEDTIKNKQILELYKTLKKSESSSSRNDLLKNLQNDLFRKVCQFVLNLSPKSQEERLPSEECQSLLTNLQLDKNDAAELTLVIAATLTQLFAIENFTGPKAGEFKDELLAIQLYKDMNEAFSSQSLIIDGCEAYHRLESPWLLKTTHLCWYLMNNLGTSRRLLELEFLVWKHRYISIYLSVLHEIPEIFLNELRKVQDFIFDHHIINDLKENKTQLVRFNKIELCCELIQSSLLRGGITSGRKIFEYASEVSGVTIEHTGVLGKRTRFQQKDIPQLVIRVSKGSEEDLPRVGAQFEPDFEGLPQDIELNDDTLLPEVSFVSDSVESTSAKQDLSLEAQLLMLTRLDYILKTEVMEESLKDEWTLAYLRSIIYSATIWSVRYKSLAQRSLVERKQMRKMDRSLLQLEDLIKTVDKEYVDGQDILRMKSFYSVLPMSKWQMQKSLGDISFDLCLYKNALEVYIKIEYWEGIIKCYSALGETTKAEIIIRQELAKQETPYLYCLLGDVTDDIQCYEKSWALSKGRFARAKKSIGTYHYVRKEYSAAIENYELAHEASPSNVSILSLLAYSCLLVERYDRAAECYRNLTYQDDTNFLAWNNLSKAYIKLGQKERAWRTLREAIKCNYEEPKIWENFMLVSMELGALEDVILSWNRLIEIRGSHKDDQILSALTYSLIKKSYNNTDPDVIKLFEDAIKLVARNSTTAACSPRVWICYLRLLIRQYELEKIAEDTREPTKQTTLFNSRLGKIKICLQRATPTTMISDSYWHQSPDKIEYILDAHEEIIDCFELALNILGPREEILLQWKSFRLSVNNTLKTLKQKGYAQPV